MRSNMGAYSVIDVAYRCVYIAGPSPRFKKWSGERHGQVPKARVGESLRGKFLINWCL